MDTDDLKRLADDPEFIPGIHNFCDRWCERCLHTARCSVYAIEQEELHAENGSAHEGTPSGSIDKLPGMLRLTMAMIREQAQEMGIDLDAVTRENESTRRDPYEEAKEQPCVKKAEAYRDAVSAWLDRIHPTLEQKGEELASEAQLNLPGQTAEAEFLELREALAIVQWYHLFIGVKLVRAASQCSLDMADESEHEKADILGSSKVALIAMDRSLAAWAQLRLHLPGQGDTILDFLVQLERLCKATEAWQPDARAFVRPGLDEEGARRNQKRER